MTSGPGREERPVPGPPAGDAAALIAELSTRGLTLAIAESLTGGLLTAEFIRPPGASAVVAGGVVAYATAVKADLLGVDRALLAEHGPVHPEVARQLARNVRRVLAAHGRPADLGLSVTGVAGPDAQGGQPPGTVFIGVSVAARAEAVEVRLRGTRDEIRAQTVAEAIRVLAARVPAGLE